MSGAGRKSHYRKAVTDDVLNSFPLPDPESGVHVAKVLQSNGGNIFQVSLLGDRCLLPRAANAHMPASVQIQFGDEKTGLAMMPTKFRKLVRATQRLP